MVRGGWWLGLAACVLALWAGPVLPGQADAPAVVQVCPSPSLVDGSGRGFTPGGLVLTTFDRSALWVVNLDRGTRYPLPDTRPCGLNCRLSPDARWITMLDPANGYTTIKMRLDGTQRTLLVGNAADVHWWPGGQLLVWTPGHAAYVVAEASATEPSTRRFLDVTGVVAVQPGGPWALAVQQAAAGAGDDAAFVRVLVNLADRGASAVMLGDDVPYFNAAAWAPDGALLAYVAPVGPGAELFTVRPGDATPTQRTALAGSVGAARINGHTVGALAWALDGTRIAFWVVPLAGPDPLTDGGAAQLHVLDVTTGSLRAYCGFTTIEHTPNPPRLVWSPDGTHIAFGGNVPGDNRGYLLLALDVDGGVFTALSDGIYPTMGGPNVLAWGLPPS